MFDDNQRRGGWARWRVAVRLARRQARRNTASSLLITLLIALPVAGLVTAATLTTSTIPTGAQVLDAALGQTQSRVEVVSGPDPSLVQSPTTPEWWIVDRDPQTGEPVHPVLPAVDDATAYLPAATMALRIQQAMVIMRTAAGVASVSALVGPAGDPAFAGRYDVTEGRAPAAADEVLVTASVLESTGSHIGGELTLHDPTRTFTITGTVDVVDQPDRTRIVVLPEAEPGELIGLPRWYLPDTALTWAQITALNTQGIVALSRPVALDPPRTGTQVDDAALVNPSATINNLLIVGSLIAAFVVYQIVLLAGAAFSVSARRQQRALAMAASVGATRADLRRTVVLQGLVLGGTGAVLGVGLGLLAAWGAMALLDDGDRTVYWGFTPLPWVTAAIAGLAILVGTISAVLPARAAAKVNVLSMLRGARRPQKVRVSRPIWGLILLVTGLAISIASVAGITWSRAVPLRSDDILAILPMVGIFAGPVLVQLGLIISGHWLLSMLARPLGKLGLAPRLAARDAAANGTRSAAALGSIGAAVMIATLISSLVAMDVGERAAGYTAAAPMGSLIVEVNGDNDEAPSVERVERAAALIAAQSPAATGVIHRQISPYSAAAQGISETAMPILSSPLHCEADENNNLAPDCRHRLDLLNGLVITTADSLEAVLGDTPSPEAIRIFRNGGALVLDRELLTAGDTLRMGFWDPAEVWQQQAGIVWTDGEDGQGDTLTVTDPDRTVTMDAMYVGTADPYQYTTLISEQTAEGLGIHTSSLFYVAAFDTPAHDAVVERISAAVGDGTGIWVRAVTGPPSPTLGLLLVLAATGILMLGTSVIVLGLARIDRQADDATLAAIGATPGLRRGIAFWQGLIIALLGAVTGATIGLLPVWGLTAESPYLSFEHAPWWLIATLALGLPLLVATINALTARRHPILTKRTAIT